MATTQTHLVAVFEDFETATKAKNALLKEGFSNDDVHITGPDKPSVQAASSGTGYATESATEGGVSGFFHRLFGSDHEDTGHYTEAVNRGSAVLTVDADDSEVDSVSEILDRYNPVNLDERPATTETAYTGATKADAITTSERTIPVVQEEMQVGKRSVQRGGVRVYSRITEQPVEESVTLHEERARVERRPVNRPATAADFNMKNEVIEVIETGEEAVVGKTARVVEEVVVGKDSTNRTETVRDTVRRTDVQVETISPEVEEDFRADYKTRYGSMSGADYNSYEPAYEYGYRMGNDPLYKGKNWNDVENSFEKDYSTSNSGSTWANVIGAVRHGWDKVTGKS